MMDFGLFALLLLAIAIGFFLGWRYRSKRADNEGRHSTQSYFRGLNYLLNEQADGAMDAFIDSLEVNSDTLDTHLALGNLLRRRGEIAKATKIHQNLLARPSLTTPQLHEAQLELARDFIKAGLLDRAEGLLQELVDAGSQYKSEALEHLVEIYQNEREWEKAIQAANQLSNRRFGKTAVGRGRARAHFCCELAEQALDKNDVVTARRYLQQALSYDKHSVRASLLWGSMEYQLGNYREALKLLQKVPAQDPDMIIESLDLVCDCYTKLGDKRGMQRYLEELLAQYPSSTLVIRMAEQIRWSKDDFAAADFLAQQLRERPTIKALSRLVELHLMHSEGRARENLQLLKQLLDQVLEQKPGYFCEQCGFTGNQLHWLCPGCKSWGTVKVITGVEGE
ncbi:lipopolysaccharide assembly protein LapB [Marinimicrobium sp. ABcell2]|uniref:lipopolysaccharide assembly protein LapB n=1 Tax=Marinimicrobium sp. ABcell2 TaxID=3069751 RepID=UPI0027AF634A|nr:lipopolysaccharide assembly protein LapB [Marinimicrobium sp. ABcell2]MDQ2075492.1 lipopolysaccharide assembly protein LapB [Marinimicrobium sp. ABcell2]